MPKLEEFIGKIDTAERRSLEKFRRNMGLRPYRRGVRNCLRCDKKFFSEDLTNQRMCLSCKSWHREVMEGM